MNIVQLDFFKNEELCEINSLKEDVLAVKKSSDKVRKGMYAKLGELTKECNDLKERLSIMERYICKGGKYELVTTFSDSSSQSSSFCLG